MEGLEARDPETDAVICFLPLIRNMMELWKNSLDFQTLSYLSLNRKSKYFSPDIFFLLSILYDVLRRSELCKILTQNAGNSISATYYFKHFPGEHASGPP